MPLSEKEFKKLLIDLEISVSEIAREVGVSHTAVIMYFRGELHSSERRAEIKAVLARRAGELGVQLPEFWLDEAPA